MINAVSNVMTLTGKARANILAAQEEITREVASRGYWESQLCATRVPLNVAAEVVKSPRWPDRIALTYGLAHRLYRARILYGWSSSRAAEALGICSTSYRSYERREMKHSSCDLVFAVKGGIRAVTTIPRALLIKASRVYHDHYFEDYANAYA